LRHCELFTSDDIFFDATEIHLYHFILPSSQKL
jgi:hypothetical protein